MTTTRKLTAALVGVCICGMSACGVTDIPKGPYQAEMKVTEEPQPYQFQRLNEYTFAVVNQKTGQVWECGIRDARCTQVMYPTPNRKGQFTNFTSIPDESEATIEK